MARRCIRNWRWRCCRSPTPDAPPATRPPHRGRRPGPRQWRRDGWRYLRFAGPPGSYRTVSYVDMLTGAVGVHQLRGALVIVGATAAGLGDLHATPMSASGQPMAGAEINANALNALRAGETIVWLDRATTAAISACTVLLLLIGLLYLSPRTGLAWSAGVGLAAVAVGMLQLRWGQSRLPPGAILLGAALAYPLWSWRRLEATQRFMDDELRLLRDADPAPRRRGRRGRPRSARSPHRHHSRRRRTATSDAEGARGHGALHLARHPLGAGIDHHPHRGCRRPQRQGSRSSAHRPLRPARPGPWPTTFPG
ncbi:MAG: CHASE2 domain-containing protein [Rhodocyclaceae bacterium]|nr:CHASE2 domain-containing protein [Rhodocyclaceae bacterium]